MSQQTFLKFSENEFPNVRKNVRRVVRRLEFIRSNSESEKNIGQMPPDATVPSTARMEPAAVANRVEPARELRQGELGLSLANCWTNCAATCAATRGYQLLSPLFFRRVSSRVAQAVVKPTQRLGPWQVGAPHAPFDFLSLPSFLFFKSICQMPTTVHRFFKYSVDLKVILFFLKGETLLVTFLHRVSRSYCIKRTGASRAGVEPC